VTENEKLRALLAEAQSRLACERYRDTWEDCDCADCALKARIEAALADIEVKWQKPKSSANYTTITDSYYIRLLPGAEGVAWEARPQTLLYKQGFCKTLEEAKEAALNAVRSSK
jgi:hypothetical protein